MSNDSDSDEDDFDFVTDDESLDDNGEDTFSRWLEDRRNVTFPSSVSSDDDSDDGHRSPISTVDEEGSVSGDESTDGSWSDIDQRSEQSPDDDDDDDEFSRSSVSSDDDSDDGHRSPMSTDDEEESGDDGMVDDEFQTQPPSDDDADDVDEGFLAPQTLDESLRSQLSALNALAEKDATVLDLQNRLDESEAARAELQTTVGRLEVRVEGLDADLQHWCGRALEADESFLTAKSERNELREVRDRLMDDRRHETDVRETLEDASTDESDRRVPSTERLRQKLDEKDRRIGDLTAAIKALQQRINEKEEMNIRLKSRIHAQQLLDLTIRVEDTEYIQNPNDVVAHITKAGMIAFFRKFLIGKKRSREDTDRLAAVSSAEALDLVGIKEEYHAEMLDVFTKVAKDTFRDRDVRAIKRRRIDE